MSRRATFVGYRCPVESGHGTLIPLAYPGRWSWYCPNALHDGWKDQPRTRAYFTMTEAETGLIDGSAAANVAAHPQVPGASTPSPIEAAAAPSSAARPARRDVPLRPSGRPPTR